MKMNFKEIRKNAGLSPTEVAHILEINLNEYSAIENGTADPTIDQLIKLSDLFNVSIDTLLGHSSPIPLSRGEVIWLNIRESLPKDKLQIIAQMLNGVNDLQLSESDIEHICNNADNQISDYNKNKQMAQLFKAPSDSDELTFDDYLILRKIDSGEKIPFYFKGNDLISNYSFTYEGKYYNKSMVTNILNRLYHKFSLLNLYFMVKETKKGLICSDENYATLKRKAKALLKEKEVEFKEQQK